MPDYLNELRGFVADCTRRASSPDPRVCRILLPRCAKAEQEMGKLVNLNREVRAWEEFSLLEDGDLPFQIRILGQELRGYAVRRGSEMLRLLESELARTHDIWGPPADCCRYPGGES